MADPRWLFIDMNAFYTSVEQQECEKLRGQPTIVVPLITDHTCAIAASYEAKAVGIRTGTSVRLARAGCPQLRIVEARPELYIDYHRRLVEILNRHFATVKVLSVDEMACKIGYLYDTREKERKLADRIKQAVRGELGACLRCSIGIAPNTFLAKVASDRQKPDGLTVWDDFDLPYALFGLKLTDLPGIGSRMKQRLNDAGIVTVEGLWGTSATDLRRVWNSVLGERWWHMLRGSHVCDYQPALQSEVKKSVGHSHVLPPQYRTLDGAKEILLQLVAKALKRLRSYGQAASAVEVTIRYRKPHSSTDFIWRRRTAKHLHTNDEATWLKVLRPMMEAIPDLTGKADPLYVGVVFSDLLKRQDMTLSLFDEKEEKSRLAETVDALNVRFGRTLDLASTASGGYTVPDRIPFAARGIKGSGSTAEIDPSRPDCF